MIPLIKFLNKSWAPSATATPNKPNPAITGPTLIPHNSKIATAPRTITRIFKPLRVQSTKGFEIFDSKFFITNENGIINWCSSQNIKIVINDLFSKSKKSWLLSETSKYEEAIKKPKTTGRNFNGPSSTSITASSIWLEVFETILDNRLRINLAISLLSK